MQNSTKPAVPAFANLTSAWCAHDIGCVRLFGIRHHPANNTAMPMLGTYEEIDDTSGGANGVPTPRAGAPGQVAEFEFDGFGSGDADGYLDVQATPTGLGVPVQVEEFDAFGSSDEEV